jgi:phosphoglycolate phosphatase
VLSNKPDLPTRVIVGDLFPDNPFEIVRGALDGVPLKPDPASSLEILSALGVQQSRAVFVGDTPVDMKTGRNAGMQSVGVTWGFRDADELLEAGADHVIHSPLELLLFLDGTAPETCRS